jgi:hypothetical protein
VYVAWHRCTGSSQPCQGRASGNPAPRAVLHLLSAVGRIYRCACVLAYESRATTARSFAKSRCSKLRRFAQNYHRATEHRATQLLQNRAGLLVCSAEIGRRHRGIPLAKRRGPNRLIAAVCRQMSRCSRKRGIRTLLAPGTVRRIVSPALWSTTGIQRFARTDRHHHRSDGASRAPSPHGAFIEIGPGSPAAGPRPVPPVHTLLLVECLWCSCRADLRKLRLRPAAVRREGRLSGTLQMIGARLTAGVALALIKLLLPFVHEAGSHLNLRSRFTSRT